MKLKETIQKDFIEAMKAKDVNAKAALSSLKSKITEAEKAKSNTELSEAEVIKVLTSAIKQRKQSIEEFAKGGRTDLVERETQEMTILEKYMPSQMTETEITHEVMSILSELGPMDNVQRLIGQTIGAFNKKFTGRADASLVRSRVETLAKGLSQTATI